MNTLTHATTPQPNGLVVLVVDDEDNIRAFASRALRMAGYHVLEASNGTDALSHLNANPPVDLLLTDVNMPGPRGDEVARRFRQAHPELKVLYLSGFVDLLFAERQMLWEDEAFLDKPFSMKSLLEAVSLLTTGRLDAARAMPVSA